MSERILLAIDDSQASARSVEYVSEMVAGRPGHYVHLIHVLPPGSPVPEARQKLSDAMPVDARTRDLLGKMREQLVAAGIQDDHVDAGTLTVPSKAEFVDGVLDAARDQQCGTIVVGRSSLPWFRELFHDHPADELIKKARGFTLWVVE